MTLLNPIAAQAQTTVAGMTPASFRVTETGAAQYRIPIQVPPGVAGLTPKLEIVYSSQAGNGALGMGWALGGLSVIHRCGKTIVQDGNNAGVAYTSSDRYCMDGQRLVSVSGTYGANATEYRTEGESFTKIVSYDTAGSGPAWFKVWTKSGLVLEFGNTTDARIEAQGKSDVRIWAVNRIADVMGNAMAISYTEDNTNGDFRPSRIDYTSNTAQSLSAGQSVRFTYETRTDISPQTVAGSIVSSQQRLTNVKTYAGETVVRDYRLAYDYGGLGSSSRITSITECTGDGSQCLAGIVPTWQASSGTYGFASAGSWGVNWIDATYPNSSRGTIADVNGDGLGDLIYSIGDTVYSALSSGTAFATGSAVASHSSLCVSSNEAGCLYWMVVFAVGDLNGDGLADVILSDGTVYLATGSGFTSAGNWGVAPGVDWQARIVDLNGDGLGDLVFVSGTDIRVSYSTGSGFTGTTTVASDSSQCTASNEVSCTTYAAAFAAGDIDGDGRADIMTGAGVVYLSTGSGFTSAGNWGVDLYIGSNGPGLGATDIWQYHFPDLADLNGDGRADLVLEHEGTIYARYSTGTGFSAEASVVSNSVMCVRPYESGCYKYGAKFAVGDANGDGLADILPGQTASISGPLQAATAPIADRISRFTDSLGATIDLTYSALSSGSVYTMESGATWPARLLRPQALLQVVSATAASDGIGGTHGASYVYRGGRVHYKGGGFLGFREIQTTDSLSGLKAVQSMRQDYPYQGLPLVAEKRQSSDTVISRTTNTWTDATLTPASGSGGSYHTSALTQSVEQSYELSGSLVTTVTSSTTYDGYGNATAITVSTGDGYSKATTNTYASPDTGNWLLGRLTRSSVQGTIP